MADRKTILTVVVVIVIVAVVGNIVGEQYGAVGQSIVSVGGEVLMLILAIWGIRSEKIYSGRLSITKGKFISGVITGLVVLVATLAIEDVLSPHSVWRSMEYLLHGPHAIAWIAFNTASALLLIGVAEELLFRGYLFEYACRRLPGRIGFIVSVAGVGILFGACHTVHDFVLLSSNHVPFKTIIQMYAFQYLWGIFSCLLYAYSKNIIYLIVLHGLIDSSLGYPLESHLEFLYLFIAVAFVLSYGTRMFSLKTNRVADATQLP